MSCRPEWLAQRQRHRRVPMLTLKPKLKLRDWRQGAAVASAWSAPLLVGLGLVAMARDQSD